MEFLPVSISCLVETGNPEAVIVVHVNEIGFSISVDVHQITYAMLIVVKVAIGREGDWSSTGIKKKA
jgi:hypothetical protein